MEKKVDLVERVSLTVLEHATEPLVSLQFPEVLARTTKPLKMPPVPLPVEQPRRAPTKLVLKCPGCKELLFERECRKNHKVCPKCRYHFRLRAHERIELLVDAGSFTELDADLISIDPLNFVSTSQVYAEKLVQEREKVGLNDAVVGPCGDRRSDTGASSDGFSLHRREYGFGSRGKNHSRDRTGAFTTYSLSGGFGIRWSTYAGGPLLTDADGQDCGCPGETARSWHSLL